MSLKTKTLEVLIGTSNLHLIEIKDSGKQIYTSRQRKSTKYLMTSLLIGSFSDGQDDNLVIILYLLLSSFLYNLTSFYLTKSGVGVI